MPAGSWTESCEAKSAVYDKGILTATCNDGKGGLIKSSVAALATDSVSNYLGILQNGTTHVLGTVQATKPGA